MLSARLLQGLGIIMVLVLLLVACGALAPGTPQEPQGTVTTRRVQVVPGGYVAFAGQSSLPDGTRLETQLLADGTPLAWWPDEAPAEVEDGEWNVRVPLGEGEAPPVLSEEKQYVLRVWQEGNRDVEAQPFAFDVSAPPAPGTGEPPGDDVVLGTANVEEVDLLIMESFPVQVAAVARGSLPDGCTKIDDVRTSFDTESKTFSVEITTVRDRDAVCTEALVPFEERVDLDVYGLPAGTYKVDVNGVRETFELAVDNEPQASSRDVPWDEARALILAGEVRQVTQLHSLEVTLEMEDGRRLVTIEPTIDAVFNVVETCGEPCAHMVLATE